MPVDEGRLAFAGLSLAFKAWGDPEAPPVLALHGWMDNAGTFELLAPALADLRLIALDFSGHGFSSLRPPGSDYYIWSYVEEVLALAGHLKLERFRLLGHSMGGSVALLAAALFPERVERVALLDSLGPLATEAAQAPRQMRRALEIKAAGETRARLFATREAAEQARADRGITLASARLLGLRGIERREDGWYWRADRRLTRPNPLSLTEEQVSAFLQAVAAPALLVAARPFWRERRAMFERRLPWIPGLKLLELEGNHYQHMEGQVEEVAAALRDFLVP